MTFQWPYFLVGLALVPLLAGFYLLAQRRRLRYAMRFTNLALLSAVVGRRPGARRHIPPALFLLGVAALLVALARPTALLAMPRNANTVIVVMDTSGSMAADDLPPTRMDAAKQAAHMFVQKLPAQTRVGLVRFNSAASVAASPTTDHAAVLRAIDTLTPHGGTAIGDGLDLALDQLNSSADDQSTQTAPKVVVLLSDGASQQGMTTEEATARAVRASVKVYTVGVGQRGAQPIVQGQLVQLDEAALQQMASQTDGKYFYAEESGTLQQIYTDLSSTIGWTQERTEITALVSALGTLLVLSAGMLSLRWFNRLP
jgi:Ca-activated chloride channel family protein